MLIRAAGAVAWRPGPDGPEVLLVHRPKYDDWSLPKGKREPGEPLPVTAVREVREESGATITLGRHLAPVRYKSSGNPKQADYWAAQVTATDEAAVPNHEVDQVAWLPIAEALKRVTYRQDVAVLIDFADGQPGTTPLILLRHAKAIDRSLWTGADTGRPLAPDGADDATRLVGPLACFAPRAAVVSSPAARCLDTVRPYTAWAGGTAQASAALAVPPRAGLSPSPLVFSLLAARRPAIVCAHRENLPALLDSAVGFLGGKAIPDKLAQPLDTGAFLVLHMAAGALTAIDRYDSFDD
jgi:8-oxo-(d)GTP phosphatase